MSDLDDLTLEEKNLLDEFDDPDVVVKNKYQMDEELQREILGLLLNDKYFVIQSTGLINPEYFSLECHKIISRLLFKHFEKYKYLPTKIQMVQELKTVLDKREPKIRVHYLGELNTVYEYYVPGIESREYYLDKVKNFAKIMAMKNAFQKCLDEFNKAPEEEDTWARIETLIRDAMSVDRNFDIGLDYFQSFEERYERMRLKKETGDYFITGFKSIDDSLAGGGLGRGEIGSIIGLPGTGKTYVRDTPILMYDGTIKMCQDIVIGDLVMGDDSTARKVLNTHRLMDRVYEVRPVKGDSYFVNSKHILSLKNSHRISQKRKDRGGRTNNSEYRNPTPCFINHPARVDGTNIYNISVEDWFKQSAHFKIKMKGWRTGVEFLGQEVKIDPYILGMWLGDGTKRHASFTNTDEVVINAIYTEAKSRGLSVRKQEPYGYFVSGKISEGNCFPNTLLNDLKHYNLLENKHIPHDYKFNDRETRLQLLAGLLDTDGELSSGGYSITQKLEVLADDICFIARSLGLAAYKKKCVKSCQTGSVGTYYRVSISGDCSVIPVRIKRKIASKRRQIKDVLLTGINVIDTEKIAEFFGFETDGNRLYLLGDFTVVHNSIFLVNTAMANIHRGKKVLYVSLEINGDKCAERFDAQFANPQPYGDLNNGINTKNLYEKKDVVFESLRSYVSDKDDKRLLIVKQFPGKTMDMSMFRAYYAQLTLLGFIPDLVIVDYIGEMKDYPNMQIWESRPRLVGELRSFAVEQNVALMTAMQVDGKSREIIKCGGVIDDDNLGDAKGQNRALDALWSMNQLKDERDCNLGRVFVIKHRDGKGRFELHVEFDYGTLKMREISQNKYTTIHNKHKNETTKTIAENMNKKPTREAQVDAIVGGSKSKFKADAGYQDVEDPII